MLQGPFHVWRSSHAPLAARWCGRFGGLLHGSGRLGRRPRADAFQTEGPFYPDKLPLDTDNDLIVINDSLKPSVGEITWLSGRILGASGQPLRNAVVEIWQCDNSGAYLHSGTTNAEKRDTNFQASADSDRLNRRIPVPLKPVPYPGRTPHIHFQVKVKGQEPFTTQCYVKDHPNNARDGILNSVRDPQAKASILVDFAPIKESKVGELAAKFDIVLGLLRSIGFTRAAAGSPMNTWSVHALQKTPAVSAGKSLETRPAADRAALLRRPSAGSICPSAAGRQSARPSTAPARR
jgi:protocatechuate 3,4-dioxygenase beta subunit